MRHGYVKVAAVTPDVRVADCAFNGDRIIEDLGKCKEKGVKIAVFPELAITGYTCGDLFFQSALLDAAKKTLKRIMDATKDLDMFVFVGLPIDIDGKLYNAAAALMDGELLGVIPKKNIPNYGEHYEARAFSSGIYNNEIVDLGEELGETCFGTDIIFVCKNMPNLKIAAEICEDIWVTIPPSNYHALAGATVIANLSASGEVTGKDVYRRTLVGGQSAKLIAGYIYAACGEGESTGEMIFGGHNMICENGVILAEKKRFENGMIVSEIDVDSIAYERMRITSFNLVKMEHYYKIGFAFKEKAEENGLERKVAASPFIPERKEDRRKVSEDVTMIQALGLKKRLQHIHGEKVLLGLSGGLDSTLALLVTVKTFDMLGLDRKNIIAVTMPGFGTTDRTYHNASELAKVLDVGLKEVDIREAVSIHLRDIGHEENKHDVTYENAQARERTQVLMDLANDVNGIVVGTGDMSEMALGWATYNGDHMSMYGVNSSVPKTLVRYLVLYFAELAEEDENEALAEVLYDILDTPVSPELLPPKQDGTISQKTEDIVGPYELHDFFLYYMLRWGFSPDKIFRLANKAFAGVYEPEFILGWLKTFYRRFFMSQYKRSCVPDGVRVGSVGLSPRGDLKMPSDASVESWMKIIEEIDPKIRR